MRSSETSMTEFTIDCQTLSLRRLLRNQKFNSMMLMVPIDLSFSTIFQDEGRITVFSYFFISKNYFFVLAACKFFAPLLVLFQTITFNKVGKVILMLCPNDLVCLTKIQAQLMQVHFYPFFGNMTLILNIYIVFFYL